MRKLLLASTALVALGSFSAHAADITISGGYNFIYTMDGENTADETTTAAEGDVNIKFSNTTDSGITTTLNYGLHETGTAGAGQPEDQWHRALVKTRRCSSKVERIEAITALCGGWSRLRLHCCRQSDAAEREARSKASQRN